MVRNETDMTEHPENILRALADPERLRIAGVARLQPDQRTYRLDRVDGVYWRTGGRVDV